MAAQLRTYGIISVFLLLAAGCSRPFDPPPRSTVVSHMDISQKKAYIDKTRSTLKIFHSAALDLNHRGDYPSRSEFAGEVDTFIRSHVRPIVSDFEAGSSLATRIGVAELQLLSGMIYLELEEFRQVRLQLNEMEQRYGNQPEVLNAALDTNESGFRDLDQGIRSLRERLYSGGENPPSPRLL